MSSEPGWISVARLLRPQGRRGELLAESLSDLPGLFAPGRQFRLAAQPVVAGSRAGRPPSANVQPTMGPSLQILDEAWTPTGRNAGRVVLKLAGVDSISAAEALTGRELLLAEQDLGPRDPDTFLVGELLGCTLCDRGQAVGEVVDVQFVTTPDGRQRLEEAAPLLVVRLTAAPARAEAPLPDGSSLVDDAGGPAQSAADMGEDPTALVPFIKAWLLGVDLQARTVDMALPAGLLDVAGAS